MVGNGWGLAHLDHGSTLQYRMRLRLVRPFCLRTGHNQACIVDEIVRCRCGTCMQTNASERERWRLTHVDERLAGTAVHQELDATLMPLTRCRMERRVLHTYSYNIDVGMPIKKELDGLMIAIVRCRMEWCGIVLIASIDVGLSIQEELDTLMNATARRPMEWCAAAPCIDIGLSIKKELETLKMATRRCLMKWCPVVGINSIDVGLSIKKELDALTMATRRCLMKWCPVVISSIDVGMSIKKELDTLKMAID